MGAEPSLSIIRVEIEARFRYQAPVNVCETQNVPSTTKVDAVTILAPATCKAARAGLDIQMRDLAGRADVAANTLLRFEKGEELRTRTVKAIQQALEDAGAVFLDDDGSGPGVRFRPNS